MHVITGKSGKKYQLCIDLNTALRIKEKLPEFDLFNMQENPHIFHSLRTDPFKLHDFLSVAVDVDQFEPSADPRMVLANELDANALKEAREAIRQEFLDFIPAERKDGTSQLLDTAACVESDLLQAQAEGVRGGGIQERAVQMIRERISKLSDS